MPSRTAPSAHRQTPRRPTRRAGTPLPRFFPAEFSGASTSGPDPSATRRSWRPSRVARPENRRPTLEQTHLRADQPRAPLAVDQKERRRQTRSRAPARCRRRCVLAYGNSTSTTNAIGVVVPSISRRIASMRAAASPGFTWAPRATRTTDRSTPAGTADQRRYPCSVASIRRCPGRDESPGCGDRRRDRTSGACREAPE